MGDRAVATVLQDSDCQPPPHPVGAASGGRLSFVKAESVARLHDSANFVACFEPWPSTSTV